MTSLLYKYQCLLIISGIYNEVTNDRYGKYIIFSNQTVYTIYISIISMTQCNKVLVIFYMYQLIYTVFKYISIQNHPNNLMNFKISTANNSVYMSDPDCTNTPLMQ